jgi:hypothetical protein
VKVPRYGYGAINTLVKSHHRRQWFGYQANEVLFPGSGGADGKPVAML